MFSCSKTIPLMLFLQNRPLGFNDVFTMVITKLFQITNNKQMICCLISFVTTRIYHSRKFQFIPQKGFDQIKFIFSFYSDSKSKLKIGNARTKLYSLLNYAYELFVYVMLRFDYLRKYTSVRHTNIRYLLT